MRGKDDYVDVIRNEASADFFKIYAYDFVSGRPFTQKEVEGKEAVCVISDALAERLYGKGVDALGKTVAIEGSYDLRVVGVLRGCSQLTPDSYVDIIAPYTLFGVHFGTPYRGLYSLVCTVKDNYHLQALKQELDDIAARMQQAHPEVLDEFNFGEGVKKKLVLTKGVETHPMHVLRTENRDHTFDTVTVWELVKHYASILFVLLFVPALNLCAIVAGRMERRSAEMAVRKTFIGGIIGLVLSWLSIYGLRREILGMFFDNSTLATAPVVEGEMLFAPTLFIGAFAAIMLLNLIAAVVPAWWSLRKPIVESMMEKR